MFSRRQDGNYNGGFNKYCTHMEDVRAKMEENFIFTKKWTAARLKYWKGPGRRSGPRLHTGRRS